MPEGSDSEEDDFEHVRRNGNAKVDEQKEAVREMVEVRKVKTRGLGKVREAIRRRGVRVTEG